MRSLLADRRLRWIIAGMLLVSTMINYTDRLTLSVLVGEVRRDLRLGEADYAQIVSVFLFSYAVMYAVSGYVVDRVGTRRAFGLFACGWSLSQMLHALAVGKWSLAGCRFLLGLTEPGNFPAAVTAIREWFPEERRALGVGIFNAGPPLGAAVASPVAAFLGLRYGWRSAFLFTGGLGLIWVALWLAIYRRPEGAPAPSKPEAGTGVPWQHVICSRPGLVLMLVRFLADPVIYFVIFWLPAYLQKERGFDLAMVGRYAWVPYLFGDIGYIFGGWLSGRLIERGWTLAKARRAAMTLGAALLPAAIAAPLVPTAQAAIAVTCMVVFGHAVWIANLLTLPADLFGENEVGTATGFSGMAGSFGGILANLAIGYIVSRYSFRLVFVVAGVMHPISMTLVYFLLPDRYFARGAHFRNSSGER